MHVPEADSYVIELVAKSMSLFMDGFERTKEQYYLFQITISIAFLILGIIDIHALCLDI